MCQYCEKGSRIYVDDFNVYSYITYDGGVKTTTSGNFPVLNIVGNYEIDGKERIVECKSGLNFCHICGRDLVNLGQYGSLS